jgi:alanyl-tRNA synthetase
MLRQIGDRIKQAAPNSVAILASVGPDGVSLVGMASDEAVRRGVNAGALVRDVSLVMGGSGGGKPSTGQGGGKDASKLVEALKAAEGLARAQIGEKA